MLETEKLLTSTLARENRIMVLANFRNAEASLKKFSLMSKTASVESMLPFVFVKILRISAFKLHSLMYKCDIETDFLNANESTAAHPRNLL